MFLDYGGDLPGDGLQLVIAAAAHLVDQLQELPGHSLQGFVQRVRLDLLQLLDTLALSGEGYLRGGQIVFCAREGGDHFGAGEGVSEELRKGHAGCHSSSDWK